MIKLMVAALWISIATTGALLFSFQTSQAPDGAAEKKEDDAFQGLDFVRTSVISVPVFDKGRVHGYFLARLVFTAAGPRLAELKLPAEALITDEVYSYLFGNPQIDFTEKETFDIDAFRAGLRDSLNERLGEDFVQEILVEQIDYLPKDATAPRNTAL